MHFLHLTPLAALTSRSPWPWPWIAAGVAILLLGLALGRGWRRWVERRRAARARRLGRRGERRGLKLLTRAGYSVVETQASGHIALVVDGEPARFPVRADAVVTRGGRCYVAEIKGGPDNASLSHRGTRRQIIEYIHAFDADGVLLVDVPNKRVRRVELGQQSPS